MSELRDIRLLIARHLDLPSKQRAAVINVLNIVDTALDAEGWQAPDEVLTAIEMLNRACLDHDDDTDMDDEDDFVELEDHVSLDELTEQGLVIRMEEDDDE